MMRLKTASLAILGTAAIVVSVLAGPAMAEGTAKGAKAQQASPAMAKGTAKSAKAQQASPAMAKGTMAKDTMAKGAKAQTLAKQQRHVQRQATYRSARIRNANAALPPSGRIYRRPAGPGEVAGNVVGGAAATAGAIATAPLRAFDNNNYYGYGYGGRDWKTYAARNKLACTPGTTFKGPDGLQHLCQ